MTLDKDAWVANAVVLIWLVSLSKKPFTSKDVWDMMPDDLEGFDPRWMGVAFNKAKAHGFITHDGQYRYEQIHHSNAKPTLIWRGVPQAGVS